ncbi:MULE transposase domain [Dillenia turbinata]|uniref:MULE transposase domain n=1 Tax=Dillenia turbinata TaxID=194707 RepID=A0AAN8UHM4_9MAGN
MGENGVYNVEDPSTKWVMAGKKIIAICQLGGEFRAEEDGSLSYVGGDAHAIDIDDQMKFDDFKLEVAEMFNCSIDNMIMKYFLPGNKKTLITISNDKDLKRMIKFSGDSITVDIYLMREEVIAPDVSNMPASRSSRTTLSEAVVLPVDAPLDVVDDTTNPDVTLGVPLDVVDGTAQIDDHIDIPTEVPFILPLHSSNTEKHVKSAMQWENTITGVGQRFNSVNDFRETLRKYAIAHQFAFKYKKNDSHRVTVKCKAEGCPWRIHASRLTTTQLICIKKMNPTHTCEGSASTTGHQATRSWVASIIKEKLKVFPNYKPKDIVNDIKQEYGIQLNYFQAWRGKEIAKEQLQGSYKEAYKQLPIFCEKIMETNPGSLATFTTKEDSSFHRLFVSFHASLYGFQQGCRPLLFLDSIPLKSKYQGMLLAATAVDGDDGFFPVAFAIVDAETDDNWRWFLIQLQAALSTSQAITFVADRQKGLKESISTTFENSFHGYCLRYLSEQLLKELKGQFSNEVKRLMVMDFYAAAYAPKLEEFQRCAETIKNISLEAYNWVMQSEPKHWANAFFEGARYNHMMSNFGELFYSWVSEANELPIIQMVDVIRGKIMGLICARREDSNRWLTRLTPSMEGKLEKENLKVRSLQVLLSAGSTFEVRGDSVEIVDIDNWACTCKGWQLSGLPCCHAIAVFSCIGRNPYDYCSRYFTTEVYRLTYTESINPISDVGRPLGKGSSQTTVMVTPPQTRRPPGRPTTKRHTLRAKRADTPSPSIDLSILEAKKCRLASTIQPEVPLNEWSSCELKSLCFIAYHLASFMFDPLASVCTTPFVPILGIVKALRVQVVKYYQRKVLTESSSPDGCVPFRVASVTSDNRSRGAITIDKYIDLVLSNRDSFIILSCLDMDNISVTLMLIRIVRIQSLTNGVKLARPILSNNHIRQPTWVPKIAIIIRQKLPGTKRRVSNVGISKGKNVAAIPSGIDHPTLHSLFMFYILNAINARLLE